MCEPAECRIGFDAVAIATFTGSFAADFASVSVSVACTFRSDDGTELDLVGGESIDCSHEGVRDSG